jgi:hypothetical protein
MSATPMNCSAPPSLVMLTGASTIEAIRVGLARLSAEDRAALLEELVESPWLRRSLRPAELPSGRCVWPSRHHLDDPRFWWCGGPVEHVGAAYCPKHRLRSLASGEPEAERIKFIPRWHQRAHR